MNLFEHVFEGDLGVLDVDESVEEWAGTERAYVLSASGTKVRLRFPHLAAFQDSLMDVPTVLKAELVLPAEPESFDKPIPAPDRLFVLLENAEGNLSETPDEGAPIPVDGTYDATRKSYVFNLSSTVQALMKGELDGRELYLVSSRRGISVSSVVLKGTTVDDPARLTLTLGR